MTSTRAYEPVRLSGIQKMSPLGPDVTPFLSSSAVLIDKDQSPKWNPPTLEEVSDQMVEQCFSSLGDKDLTF